MSGIISNIRLVIITLLTASHLCFGHGDYDGIKTNEGAYYRRFGDNDWRGKHIKDRVHYHSHWSFHDGRGDYNGKGINGEHSKIVDQLNMINKFNYVLESNGNPLNLF